MLFDRFWLNVIGNVAPKLAARETLKAINSGAGIAEKMDYVPASILPT
jgi:hypothetical protein